MPRCITHGGRFRAPTAAVRFSSRTWPSLRCLLSGGGAQLAGILAIGLLLACGTAEKTAPDGPGVSDGACCDDAASAETSLQEDDAAAEAGSAADATVRDATVRDIAVTPDDSGPDAAACECRVGVRSCVGDAVAQVCGEDCQWQTTACASGRCVDGVCCECEAGQQECDLYRTAQRTCSDGCSWSVTLCLAKCRGTSCCTPCGPEFEQCATPMLYEHCQDGCVVQQQCSAEGCAASRPYAPFTRCESQFWDGHMVMGCFCMDCRTDQDCGTPHTLGVTCGLVNRQNACVCEEDDDCIGKTAGPRCLQGQCGCLRPMDCPGAESCVPAIIFSPVPRARVCSGNPIWPAEQ